LACRRRAADTKSTLIAAAAAAAVGAGDIDEDGKAPRNHTCQPGTRRPFILSTSSSEGQRQMMKMRQKRHLMSPPVIISADLNVPSQL